MPRKVTPGVYVEEVRSRPKAIEAASTSITAFVGPTLSGSSRSALQLLASYAEFERIYGGSADHAFAPHLNFMAHGARAYFNEGGRRLYVARVGSSTAAPTLAAYRTALGRLAARPDISIVAAPGHTEFRSPLAEGVARAMVDHVEQLKDRIAVLEVPSGQTVQQAQAYRAKFDSSYAALYYPWVVTSNPGSAGELTLPPSPFICGICARVDAARGVHKAPANEPVKTALRFERPISTSEQDQLNPLGVNCLRTLPGKGNLVWGARTLSSDPEWKYLTLRRYFAYIEKSLTDGTSWVVFEPNDEPLWASIRLVVSDFLQNEWRRGALAGDKPEQAYFVKCDRTTMTQDDIDNGRLVCLVGFAALRPAEFVIFRIGQTTRAAKSP